MLQLSVQVQRPILDLPKTLEILETKGVPVLGFQTDELPAFYTRKSGLKVDHKVEVMLKQQTSSVPRENLV